MKKILALTFLGLVAIAQSRIVQHRLIQYSIKSDNHGLIEVSKHSSQAVQNDDVVIADPTKPDTINAQNDDNVDIADVVQPPQIHGFLGDDNDIVVADVVQPPKISAANDDDVVVADVVQPP